MFAQEVTSQDLAIQSAYLQIVEKRQKEHKPSEQDVERVEAELEKIADEIKEELKESSFDIDKLTGKSKVSQAVMDRIHKAAQEYHDFVTPEYLEQMMQKVLDKKFSTEDDKHKHIHDDNDSLKEDSNTHPLLAKWEQVSKHIGDAYEAVRNNDLAAARKHIDAAKAVTTNAKEDKDQVKGLHEALIEALTGNDFESRASVASSTKDPDILASLAQAHLNVDTPDAAEICNHVARNPATPKYVLEKLAKHHNPKVVESADNNLTARDSQVNESYSPGRTLSMDTGAGRVIKAYLQGRPAKHFSKDFETGAKKITAETDGKSYWLHGNKIATKNEAGEHEFDWTGWYTPTTERHLNTILSEVAPGKRVYKTDHRDKGIDKFTVKDLS